ncbi:MAG: sugar transferase, partial [Inconstantimicrobium porci]|nr:sugar transferase [Inconstantimicrobium porci]
MKNKEWGTGLFKFLTFFVDSVIVVFSVYITFLLLFDFKPPKWNIGPFIDIIPLIIITYLIFMYVFGLHD